MFRFLHAADIHLDSKQVNLPDYPDAPKDYFRLTTRRAFENLIKLAIDQKVAFVLIVGDLSDGTWRDQRTLLWLQGQTAKLRDHQIKVILIQGNHDAQNQMTTHLSWTENVKMLSATQPETFVLPEFDVKIHGQGFIKRAVTENLAKQYPQADSHCFNIGMLHTSAGGYEGHEPYAPCTLDDLIALRYQYWALGHVHTRMDLSSELPIVFPGNIQGRHIREVGPKGCTLVEVDNHHQITSRTHHNLDVVRWMPCAIDVTGCAVVDDVFVQVGAEIRRLVATNDSMPLAVRVELQGVTDLDSELVAQLEQWTQEIRGAARDQSDRLVWVEEVRVRTNSPKQIHQSMLDDGPLAELFARLDQLNGDETGMQKLVGELDDIKKKLNVCGLTSVHDSLGEDGRISDMIRQAGPLIMNRLKTLGGQGQS